jgi:hypothetical protein
MKSYLVLYNDKYHFVVNNAIDPKHLFDSVISNMGFSPEGLKLLEVDTEDYEKFLTDSNYFTVVGEEVLFIKRSTKDITFTVPANPDTGAPEMQCTKTENHGEVLHALQGKLYESSTV